MNLKRFFTCVAAVCFIVPVFMCRAQALGAPGVSAASAALMVVETGELIYGKNEHDRRSMASTTKIMTSLLALEQCMPSLEVTVNADMLNVEGTSMGLLAGDSVTLKTLVYGMLLQSGNDAANVTAITVGGDVEGFVSMMNDKAKQLGMDDTNFETPSGLDSDEHYSTAYDMALLGCAAMKNPEFAAICSQKQAAVYYGNPPYRRTLTNHNRLLRSFEDAVGIKTGFTKKSGRCLVSAARRDGVTLVAVTLNAPDDWNDHKAMLEYGFSLFENRAIDYDISSLSLGVVGGTKPLAGVELSFSPSTVVRSGAAVQARQEIYIKQFEYAPIKRGTVVGEARFYDGEKLISSVPIVASEDVDILKIEAPQPQEEERGFFSKIFDKIRSLF